jgi:leucyl-tRNA synthetase
MLVEDTVELPVQVNGKVRSRIVVAAGADAARVEAIALAESEGGGGARGQRAAQGHRRAWQDGQRRRVVRRRRVLVSRVQATALTTTRPRMTRGRDAMMLR